MADATAAARLASNEGAHAYVCSTAVPSSIVDVARPAIAMATSGSPNTALAYQRLVKPSASARSACCTIRSMVVPPPGNPMRMERTFPPRSPACPTAGPGTRSGATLTAQACGAA